MSITLDEIDKLFKIQYKINQLNSAIINTIDHPIHRNKCGACGAKVTKLEYRNCQLVCERCK